MQSGKYGIITVKFLLYVLPLLRSIAVIPLHANALDFFIYFILILETL